MSANPAEGDPPGAAAAPEAGSTVSGAAPEAHQSFAAPPLAWPPPKVTSVVPAMCVPLEGDLTQPFDPPRDRIERASTMLQSIDFHRTGVRRGMLHLADMDRQRILAEAARAEGLASTSDGVPPPDDGLDLNEADAMIGPMQAPANPDVDYNITNEYLASHVPRFWSATDRSDRRDTVRQLQQVAENAANQLGGYEAHIGGIRAGWQAALDKEQKLLDARFGGLPTVATAGSNAAEATQGTTGTASNTENTSGAMSATPLTAAIAASGGTPGVQPANAEEDVVMGGT